jgi:PKD repeat protein
MTLPLQRGLLSTCLLIFTCIIPGSISHAQTSSYAQTSGWPTHSHDAQHTGVSSTASQSFGTIHWSAPVDLAPPSGEILIHYGSPVITPANTVIVPVKTGTNSFRVEAHNGATGSLLWMQDTGWVAPSAGFMPGLGSTLFGKKLFVPDSAGRVIVRTNPDLATGHLSDLVFYGEKNYKANPQVYQQTVLINTPLTIDAKGNLYFGFVVVGSTPIGLQSGLARIARDGTGTWVSAATISGDSSITQVATSCAPALSSDGSMVYVAVSSDIFQFGYLMALNSTTLAVVNKALLLDPSSGDEATVIDESSATPTVGPDGDVYFGVLENPFPDHNDRGWMLHFNSDLSQSKIPGSFGWDDTPSIVDASLVASYQGTSKYLIMTKYNNYAGIGTGDGHNRVAILDPNATEPDPVIPTTLVMNEVITHLGVTRDPDATGFPGAVREWCINTAAVDPFTKSVMVNSEDGKLYRWDLTTNKLSEHIKLAKGIGEAYTPTEIGPDGTVYAINHAVLSAVGD